MSAEDPAGKSGARCEPQDVLFSVSGSADESLHVSKQTAGRSAAYWRTVVGSFLFSLALLMLCLVATSAIHIDFAGSVWQPVLYTVIGFVVGGVIAAMLLRDLKDHPDLEARIRASAAAGSVRSLTSLAALLAGRQGPVLYAEWNAHLRGNSGHEPVTLAQVRDAAGFVVAGLRDRGQDWADAGWRPVDAVLRSRFLSGLFVAVPTIVVAFEVLTHKGAMTVLTSWGSIFCVGTGLAAAVKAGRKYRDVQLPEPKARRAKE